MFIKTIVIEGVEGDVEISRIEGGALVTAGNQVVCDLRCYDAPEERFRKATLTAKAILGIDRHGRVNATNSMIGEVLREIERVANG